MIDLANMKLFINKQLEKQLKKKGSYKISGQNFDTYFDDVYDAVKTKLDIDSSGGIIKASVAVVPHRMIVTKGGKYQPRANGQGQDVPKGLKDSITSYGMLTPLVVDEQLNLLSGFHRYAAMADLFDEQAELGQVNGVLGAPVIVASFDSEDDKHKYSRDSNIHLTHKAPDALDAESMLKVEIKKQKTFLDTQSQSEKVAWAESWVRDEFGLSNRRAEKVSQSAFKNTKAPLAIDVPSAYRRRAIQKNAWAGSQAKKSSSAYDDATGEAYIHARDSEVGSVLGSLWSTTTKLSGPVDINVSGMVLAQKSVKTKNDVNKKRATFLKTCERFNNRLLIPAGAGIIKTVLLFGQIKNDAKDKHTLYVWDNKALQFKKSRDICE